MGRYQNLFCCILISVLASSYAQQNCSTYSFTNNNIYTKCITLPVLSSFLHWNYHPTNGTVDIAFRQTGVSASQWVCWALNLDRPGMVGSQCLVAFTNSSGLVEAYTSSVDGYDTTMQRSALRFSVPRIAAERVGSEMFIYATLVLPSGRTSFTHVWQVGPVSGNSFVAHSLASANRRSVGTVDFIAGQTSANGGSVG